MALTFTTKVKSLKSYTEANRAAWNEAMPKHQSANPNKWDERFSKVGYSILTSPEIEQLEKIGIKGKDIAHLCCNNGVELMSLKNLGARTCIGFDISDIAIAEATKRAEKTGIDCKFVRTDVYEIDESYQHNFDIVYISVGCFGWLPDLKKFFTIVSKLLRKGGHLFIYEMHPFSDMIPCDHDKELDPLRIIDPYFKDTPHVENDGIDYVGKTSYESLSKYWFVWPISDLIMSIIDSGLTLQYFKEYAKDISASHKRNEAAGLAIPLSYIIVGEKSKGEPDGGHND